VAPGGVGFDLASNLRGQERRLLIAISIILERWLAGNERNMFSGQSIHGSSSLAGNRQSAIGDNG